MSWSVPNHAPWNPAGVAMHGMPDMNSASYTPEQWALIQQQNWQQWTQWQQQYSQWQNQYGDKYAQQLQTVQNIGGIPPPPPSGVVPPPPPDKPPPPPPHENNQPLFNSNHELPPPAPNPPQQRNNTNYNPNSTGSSNTQWSCSTEQKQQPAVNAEALRKLAEEERLFDIQFQKWDEEINKWQQENVNHPDKQAYKDYEAKFEACRKQLLERRQQMKTKRANLLNNPAHTSSTNISIPSSPSKKTNENSYIEKPESQNSQKTSYERQYDSSQTSYLKNNKNVEIQDRYENYHQSASGGNNYSAQQNLIPQGNKSDNFLSTTSSDKGIPGLDLVPDSSAKNYPEVIDLSDDQPERKGKTADYSTITMGINNILGDEKIMNILSMVRGLQPAQEMEKPNANHNEFNNDNQQFLTRNQNFNQQQLFSDRHNTMANNRQGPFSQQNQDKNTPFQPSQQGGNYNRQNVMNQNPYCEQNNQYDGHHSLGGNIRPHGLGSENHQGVPGIRQSGPGMRNSGPSMHQIGSGVPHGGPRMNPIGSGMRLNGPGMQQVHGMRQSGPNLHQGQNIKHHGLPIQQNGPKMQHSSPILPQGGLITQQGSSNNQQSGTNVQQPQPLMAKILSMPMHINDAPGRPPLHDTSSQQNYDSSQAQMQTPKPRWVEDPLFTPSIVVEYEHQSLRLKARDFIEPVHTFDYNHVSKENETKKKDFEHEADELFTRKPRRADRDFYEDRPIDKSNRVLYQRDYERKTSREDFRDMESEIGDEGRDISESRDMREQRDIRELRDMRDQRDMRESRDIRDSRDVRDPKEMRELRDVREPRDISLDMRELRDFRDMRDIKDFRERDRGRDDIKPRDRSRERQRDDFERRRDDRYDDKRRDDRDRYGNKRVVNDDYRDRESGRDYNRDRRDGRREGRDIRRDIRMRSNSRDKESRKRGLSHESEISNNSKKLKDAKDSPNQPLVMIDDLLEPPGRSMRPEKIVIILRGIPGSGKSYLAKLIRDREAEHGGTARIMSIDDYFMQEGEIEDVDPSTGKIIKKPSLKYEYDASLEDTYVNSLKRAFKRSCTDGYFPFLIYDAVNATLQSYADIWNFGRQNGFQVYICTMDHDVQSCFKRNIHKRKLEDIEMLAARFFATPAHHIQLDATTLLQSAAITDVHMEDVSDEVVMDNVQEAEVESVFTSKWEKMDDANKLARLDGTSKPLRPSQLSMEDYLQLDDWIPTKAKPGKKTVRWADIEERRQQEKMRAIGFVVGQTDWNRMTDPTLGSSALTQTKYIERVRRN